MTEKKTIALALLSGGLDSLLACRVVMAQGIEVRAIKFVTPFFGYELLARQAAYQQEVWEKYGIHVELRDISTGYLELLRQPAHGFGKNFNPCIDCKIFMLIEAKKMMAEIGASCIITGEVIGQRPMSQRRDTLRVIERDSGCDGILLRPLCAKNMPLTRVEEEGLVDREQLLAFNGRGRKPQMDLAEQYNLLDYPSPSGGCLLADVSLGRRMATFYREQQQFTVNDICLHLVGRQFRLPGGGWLAMGRDEAENQRIASLAQPGEVRLGTVDRPGPFALLRYATDPADRLAAAGLIARYAKKGPQWPDEVLVAISVGKMAEAQVSVPPLTEKVFAGWRR
jgi:hypothetical protein